MESVRDLVFGVLSALVSLGIAAAAVYAPVAAYIHGASAWGIAIAFGWALGVALLIGIVALALITVILHLVFYALDIAYDSRPN